MSGGGRLSDWTEGAVGPSSTKEGPGGRAELSERKEGWWNWGGQDFGSSGLRCSEWQHLTRQSFSTCYIALVTQSLIRALLL